MLKIIIRKSLESNFKYFTSDTGLTNPKKIVKWQKKFYNKMKAK